MKENVLKGALTVILAGAAVYFRQLLGPLIVMTVVMIADYVTGMAAAWVTGTLSSRAGVIGIIKKVGYLFVVGVAVVVDYVIVFGAENAGTDLGNFHIFGLLVTIWLILNECISILENLSEIGVPLPGFLLAIVKKLKKSTEKIGDDQAKPAPDPEPEKKTTIYFGDLAPGEEAEAVIVIDPYAELMEPEDLARAEGDPPDA